MMNRRNELGRYTDAPTGTVLERFESQFIRIPESGCWVWTGSNKNKFGHGAFKLGNRKSKVLYAHRMAWELYVGPIPLGLMVLHRCDCPCCVNPHHLFLGTHSDNMNDMVSKGRNIKGSSSPQAKINESIALKIKSMRGTPTKEIAFIFGISRQSVADIIYGRTWKHV